MTVEPTKGQVSAGEEVQSEDLPGDVVGEYQRLVGQGSGLGDRTEAARQLLRHDSNEAVQALSSALSPGQRSETWRAVLDAVTTAIDEPPQGLGLSIFSLMDQIDAEEVDAWSAAMGQFKKGKWRDQLEQIAENDQAASRKRRRAIAALGHFREQAVAERLMKLTKPEQPTAVQASSFEALATLSGIGRYGADRRAWKHWWEQAGQFSEAQWQSSIVANFARRRASRTVERGHLRERLLDAQRALYRTTATEDRAAVLTYMLGDSLLPIRKLGMDYVQQRLVDGQAFGESLRKALRNRLNDASPKIRSRAALRLRDLADQLGADRLARRLGNDKEQITAALEADLLMMASLPRQQAVGPALNMLDQRQLQDEAAAALASAYDQQMLSQAQIAQARETVRRTIKRRQGQAPSAEVVTLLAKVGTSEDWNRIAAWVDESNRSVKRASAQAWADSKRSLKLLAERAGDPVIQPIVIAAAIQRGTDARTLTSLAQHQPAQDQAQTVRAWHRALIALAGRVPTQATEQAVARLAKRKVDPKLRARMLTAAIERSNESQSAPNVKRHLRLILRRGENRLTSGKSALAVANFKRLLGENRRLTDQQTQRRDRGLVKAYLRAGEEEKSFAAARRLLGTSGDGRISQPTSNDPVVDLFLDAATAHADGGHAEEAQSVLKGLRGLLGPRIRPEIAQRIHGVEQSVTQRAKRSEPAGEEQKPATISPNPQFETRQRQTDERSESSSRAAGNP